MRGTTITVAVAIALACGRGPARDKGSGTGGSPGGPGEGEPTPTPPSRPPPSSTLPVATPPPDVPWPECPADAGAAAPAPLDAAPRQPATAAPVAATGGEACAGIGPPDEVAMLQLATPFGGIWCHSTCLPGAGDATGTLAFPQEYYDSSCHSTGIVFASSGGDALGDTRGMFLGLSPRTFQQPAGLVVSTRSYLGPNPRPARITAFDSAGTPTGSAGVVSAGRRFPPGGVVYGPDPAFLEATAEDPRGGVLLAGDLRVEADSPFEHAAVMLGEGGAGPAVRWGPVPLDSDGLVLGVGVDVLGRSLVLADGEARFGAGHVAAQWFAPDGTPLTCAFALLSGYAGAGDRAWLEAAPLLGGGLAVRRVDMDYGRPPTHRRAPLAIVESGAASFLPPPPWMAARPDATLRIVRGGRAYAALPAPAGGVAPCTQTVEVLAPDGTPCGARSYPIADGECTTRALTVAADGTVIQQLPAAMESSHEDYGNTCTWRWWAGALR